MRKEAKPKDVDEWRKKIKRLLLNCQVSIYNPKAPQWYHTLGQEMGQDSEVLLVSAMPTPMSQNLWPSQANP